MTRRLPFPDRSFDAVMSNVATHMFPDDVTRTGFAQVARLVRAGGRFVFHPTRWRTGRCTPASCPPANWSRITWPRSRARPCATSEAYLGELLAG
jgi:ubiquinone/menaquinone biosynthesis C-methylase UbiE